MQHAGPASLDQLENLLAGIRARGTLKERSPGVFYYKSRAFLHFHEDPAGLFADLRAGANWERLPVNTAAERKLVLAKVKAATTKP